jgi:hypothetical protein
MSMCWIKRTAVSDLLPQLAALLLIVSSAGAFGVDNKLSQAEIEEGWELLFDGNEIRHWRNFKKDGLNEKWVVDNGTMKLVGSGGGDILTHKSYRNFDLRLEWLISEGGNSGIFILVDEEGKFIFSHAPEIQILDNERHSDRKVDSHRSGRRCLRLASSAAALVRCSETSRVLLKPGQAILVFRIIAIRSHSRISRFWSCNDD